MSDSRKKVCFIVNPKSGTGKQKCIDQAIEKYIDRNSIDHVVRYTEYAGHAAVLTRAAVAEGMDAVIAVGGDGSVNEVASALYGTNVALGIIPMGSGNGLAHHLKLSFSPKEAIASVNSFKLTAIDTAFVNNVFFVSIAGLGFDAHVADLFAKGTKRGFLSYFKITITEYLKYKPLKYKILIDGKKLKRRAMMIVFANSDQFGYNSSVAPDASIRDGLLDVCIYGKPTLWQAPWLTWLLFTRRITSIKEVESYKAKEISIYRKKDLPVNIDGEPMQISRDLKVKIVPLSLKVIVG